jgi:nicotinamide riboside transporter PnuC
MSRAGAIEARPKHMEGVSQVNLPLITSILSVVCILVVGQRKWWGHLFGLANCILFTVIALRPGQWGYLPSNIVCFAIYARNAVRWRIGSE